MTNDELRIICEDDWITTALDCGDNSCMFRDHSKPGGGRTNGGCRCLSRLKGLTRSAVNKTIHYFRALSSAVPALLDENDRLRTEIARLEKQFDEDEDAGNVLIDSAESAADAYKADNIRQEKENDRLKSEIAELKRVGREVVVGGLSPDGCPASQCFKDCPTVLISVDTPCHDCWLKSGEDFPGKVFFDADKEST